MRIESEGACEEGHETRKGWGFFSLVIFTVLSPYFNTIAKLPLSTIPKSFSSVFVFTDIIRSVYQYFKRYST